MNPVIREVGSSRWATLLIGTRRHLQAILARGTSLSRGTRGPYAVRQGTAARRERKHASREPLTGSTGFPAGFMGVSGYWQVALGSFDWSVYTLLATRIGDHIMRASPPIALALLAFAQCSGATVEEIAQSTMPSVVEIVTYDNTGAETRQGSGFFISPQRIITNAHVVDGAYSAEIFTDEGYYDRITILNADMDMDLAILRVDAEDEIPLQISPDAELRPGQRVIAIGHPLGLDKTLSDGLISGVRTIDRIQELQITAPISYGSSGSPVLDEEGRVIGVVYAGFDEGQNLNFAIGIQTLTEFLALQEIPRQLDVAGSYVLWRVVVKWILKVIAGIIHLAIGGCVIMVAIVGIVRLWRVVSWLSKSIYRLLTQPFRQRRHCTGLATRQLRRLFRRDRTYVAVKRSLILAAVLLIAASCFLSASVNSATNPANPTDSPVAQIEPAPTTDTQSVTVYITRTGSKYHRNGCRYLRKSKIPITLNDAKQHYGPCPVCNPPR